MAYKVLVPEVFITCDTPHCKWNVSFNGELDTVTAEKAKRHLSRTPWCETVSVTHKFKIGDENCNVCNI